MKNELKKRILEVTQGSMQIKLLRASMGSCTCLTKSPDYVMHKNTCTFRLIMEVLMDDVAKIEEIAESYEKTLATVH